LFAFKRYDVVIDVEEYFNVSTFMAFCLGKKTIGFGNLWNRRIGYTYPVIYNDKQHTILTFLDLLKPLGIKTYIPEAMEPLLYKDKDTIKVDAFLKGFKLQACPSGRRASSFKLICMHT